MQRKLNITLKTTNKEEVALRALILPKRGQKSTLTRLARTLLRDLINGAEHGETKFSWQLTRSRDGSLQLVKQR